MIVKTLPIVGNRFRDEDEQERYAALMHDEVLSLVREPENPYDSNAIKVMSGAFHLGYIPRGDAVALADLMDEGWSLDAEWDAETAMLNITANPAVDANSELDHGPEAA